VESVKSVAGFFFSFTHRPERPTNRSFGGSHPNPPAAAATVDASSASLPRVAARQCPSTDSESGSTRASSIVYRGTTSPGTAERTQDQRAGDAKWIYGRRDAGSTMRSLLPAVRATCASDGRRRVRCRTTTSSCAVTVLPLSTGRTRVWRGKE